MPVFLYISPWVELFFSFLGLGACVAFCWKRGWLLGSNDMSRPSGLIYSFLTGGLTGLLIMSIIAGHFISA